MSMEPGHKVLVHRVTMQFVSLLICLVIVTAGGIFDHRIILVHAQQRMPALTTKRQSDGLHKQTVATPPYSRLSKVQAIPQITRPVTGQQNAIVILADFSDYTWDTQSDTNFVNPINEPGFEGLFQTDFYENMLFSLGSFRDPFGQSAVSGSMRDYYRENSYNQFDIDGVVTEWYTVSNSYQTYCNTDGIPNTSDDYGFTGSANVRTFVEEAVALADPDVDFSQFDGDGDGFVDAIFIVHAGPGAEELYSFNYAAHFNYFWSHQSTINYQTMDGVKIGRFTLEPQTGTIGIFCHEYGHVLGLPDLYDTDGSSEGIGEWGLMAGGGWCHLPGDRYGTSPSHFSPWAKIRLGWLQPIDVNSGSGQWRLPPIEREPVAIRLWNEMMSEFATDPLEYFLLENRQNIFFDVGLTRRQVDFNQTMANGMVIYHVDETSSTNNNESRKLIDVEEASPVFSQGNWIENLDISRDLALYEDLTSGNRGDNGDPFPGYFEVNAFRTDFLGNRTKNIFDDQSIPDSKRNDGESTYISVDEIHYDGEDIILSIHTNLTTTSAEASKTPVKNHDLTFSVFPNPIKDLAVIQLSSTLSNGEDRPRIVIYNLLGQIVRNIDFEHGEVMSYWNGRDDSGMLVQSGLYFMVLTTSMERTTQKIVLAR